MITTLSFDGFSISKAVSFGPRMISHYKVVSYNSSISIIFYREVPVTVCENGHRLVGLTVHTLIHVSVPTGMSWDWKTMMTFMLWEGSSPSVPQFHKLYHSTEMRSASR